MRNVKYALHPGWIEKSQKDGNLHFISASQLAELYGIHSKDFIIWSYERPHCIEGLRYDDYIHLYPRYDGNYQHVDDIRKKDIHDG